MEDESTQEFETKVDEEVQGTQDVNMDEEVVEGELDENVTNGITSEERVEYICGKIACGTIYEIRMNDIISCPVCKCAYASKPTLPGYQYFSCR